MGWCLKLQFLFYHQMSIIIRRSDTDKILVKMECLYVFLCRNPFLNHSLSLTIVDDVIGVYTLIPFQHFKVAAAANGGNYSDNINRELFTTV